MSQSVTLSEYWQKNIAWSAKEYIAVAHAHPVYAGEEISVTHGEYDLHAKYIKTPEAGYHVLKMTPNGNEAKKFMTVAEFVHNTAAAEGAALALPRTTLPHKMNIMQEGSGYGVREQVHGISAFYSAYAFHCLFNNRAEDARPEKRPYKIVTLNADTPFKAIVMPRDTLIKDGNDEFTVKKNTVIFPDPKDASKILFGAEAFARFGMRLKV